MKDYDCLIIGAGPCGIAASEVLFDANLNIAIVEKGMPGGTINIAPKIDNYPGEKLISGPELAMKFYSRLLAKNIETIPETIVEIYKENGKCFIKSPNETYCAKTVLIASGVNPKKIGLKKEDQMLGHGLSYCALCDGRFFKGQEVAVVATDKFSLQETLYLAEIDKKVDLILGSWDYSKFKYLIDEIKTKDNVQIYKNYDVVEIIGDSFIEGIKIKNLETNVCETIECKGFFPFVGHTPNSEFAEKLGILDSNKMIPVDKNYMTSMDGIFAAGDILPRDVRQIYLAEHDGTIAAQNIINYLRNRNE